MESLGRGCRLAGWGSGVHAQTAVFASQESPGEQTEGGETYPSGMHHALGRPGRARREHDEEGVAEGQLLELQLRGLRAFPGGKKIIQEHAGGRTHRDGQ